MAKLTKFTRDKNDRLDMRDLAEGPIRATSHSMGSDANPEDTFGLSVQDKDGNSYTFRMEREEVAKLTEFAARQATAEQRHEAFEAGQLAFRQGVLIRLGEVPYDEGTACAEAYRRGWHLAKREAATA